MVFDSNFSAVGMGWRGAPCSICGSVSCGAPAVQVLFQQRQEALAQFQQRAQVLQQAAVVLEEGIQASRTQVDHST